MWQTYITSCIDDKAALGHREAAAVEMFEVISKAPSGFFNALVGKFHQL